MRVLGIETSCDETSVAVLDDEGRVLSNVVSSQLAAHAPFGGVVPEIAARAHLENLPVAFEQALSEAGADVSEIDLVAVTAGPGLIGALLVGLSAGKALAFARGVPLVAVNHLEGHLFSSFLRGERQPAHSVEFPFHGLVVSGGHSELVRVEEGGGRRGDREVPGSGAGGSEDRKVPRYRVVPIARTRDDAPGEAFDKVARRAGLGYPGGPLVDRISRSADGTRHVLPIGRPGDGSDDFSFSGLKTAMIRELQRLGVTGDPIDASAVDPRVADLLASFQRAIVTALVDRLDSVHRRERIRRLAVSGGVAANSELRSTLVRWGEEHGIPVRMPEPQFTTDNAAMIAWAGLLRYRGESLGDSVSTAARSRWPLGAA